MTGLLKDYNIEWDETNNRNKPDALDDLFADEVLGPACSIDNPGCTSCE